MLVPPPPPTPPPREVECKVVREAETSACLDDQWPQWRVYKCRSTHIKCSTLSPRASDRPTITKRRLFKNIKNLTAKNWKFSDKKLWYFSYFCPKHRLSITKTCLYNFDPLKPHFYTIKLGFTGVYIIFLISAQNIVCGYSLEPPRWGGSNEYPQSMFWAEIGKHIRVYLKIFSFWRWDFLYIWIGVFS